MAQISTVTVPALVIAMNNVLFVETNETETVIGKVINVPCREILYDNTDRWAIPVKDAGIFTILDFEYKKGDFLAQPSYDSFTVFRIRDKESDNEWIIYGTTADLINSCATCCGAAAVPMPGISPAFKLRIAPCQEMDIEDENGDAYMLFGIPSLEAGEKYFPYGGYNNVELTPASSGGYTDITALLAFLNATWTDFVWTKTSDNLTLIATGGEIGDTLCVSVIAIVP